MNAIVENVNHAEQNAASWVESIGQMVAALELDYDRLQELRDTRDAEEAMDDADKEELAQLEADCKIDGDEMKDADEARERIQESVLSVQVRSGWRDVGDDHGDPEEFCILLTTGGPALRIMGELDEHNEPSRAWLEYQDWGTGWTQYFKVEQTTLLAFCSCFYFGE